MNSRKSLVILVLGLLGPASDGHAQNGRSEAVKKEIGMIEALVEQRVAQGIGIAKTKANWKIERSVLEATRDSLKLEVQQLEEKIAEAKEEQKTVDTQSRELSDRQKELEDAAGLVEHRIGEYETKVLAMAKRFPPFMLNDLGPVMETLNNEQKRGTASLGDRVVNIAEVLETAEKANNEIRTIDQEHTRSDGVVQSAKTTYFGLAIAYAASGDGEHAWVGYPEADGWRFEPRPEAAGAISSLVQLADGRGDYKFSFVPAKITD